MATNFSWKMIARIIGLTNTYGSEAVVTGTLMDFAPSKHIQLPTKLRPNPPWSLENEQLLRRLFMAGYSFEDLGDNLREYNMPAIRKKLVEMELMKTAYGDNRGKAFRAPWVPGTPLPKDIDAEKISAATGLPRRETCLMLATASAA